MRLTMALARSNVAALMLAARTTCRTIQSWELDGRLAVTKMENHATASQVRCLRCKKTIAYCKQSLGN
jgi:TnpA family transposase